MRDGLALSLTAIYLMVRYGECGRIGWVAGSGISAGFVSLTKPEIFLALVPAIVCGFWRTGRHGRRGVISMVWVGTMLLPPVLTFVCFTYTMSLAPAALAALAGWRNLSNPEIFGLPCYRAGMGIDNAPASIALLAGSAAAYALLFGAAGFVALRRTRRSLWLPITALVVASGVWGGNGALFRRTATVFLVGIMAVPLVVSVQHWQQSSTPVGGGLDRFRADDERGRIVQAAVEEVANRVGREETLLVMPEGVMINLTVDAGRVAPTELASRRHRGAVTAILNRHPVGRRS